MYQQDYFMRIINDMARFLAKTLLGKEKTEFGLKEEETQSQLAQLSNKLVSLISKGALNEAENLLYEILDPENKNYIELALDFYGTLNNLDDEFLEKNNFSREEIEQGLKAIARKFGVPL